MGVKQSQIRDPAGTMETMEVWGRGRVLAHYKNIVLKGTQAAGKKAINWDKVKEISQEPTENTSAFLRYPGDASKSIPPLTPESLEGNTILWSYFISKTVPALGANIRNWK